MKKHVIAKVCATAILAGFISTQAANAEDKYELSIGLNSVEGDIPYYMADFFKQAIEEKSNGAVTIHMYPGGQMGGDNELIENVMAGTLDFYSGNISNTVQYVPPAAVMDSHYSFDDLQHFRRLIDSDFFNILNDEFIKAGMRITSVAEVGMRELMSNKDIKSVEDMKGLKVRVMQNKYHIEAWKNMGAAPTPMDWGEVYVGLQQKMIDAVENPYFFICSSKLYEVQDHILETEHLPQPAALFMSEESFQNLPEDIQKLVLECGEIAKVKTREVSDTMLADRIQEIKDHGVTITKPSDEMLNQLREMVKPSNELIHQDVGDEFYATFSKYLEQTRNAK